MTKLYHRTICWKTDFDTQSVLLIRTAKSYSRHMIEDHFNNVDYKHDISREKLTQIVRQLKRLNEIHPYEIECEDFKVTKCVVRVGYDEYRDVSIVFRQGKVITAWLNNKNDTHTTLNTRKYAKN